MLNNLNNCCLLTVLIVGAVVVIYIVMSNEAKRRAAQQREEARQAYVAALNNLKAHPTNPDLKQTTLELGRVYSNLTRNKQGVTLFDEVALMNDINAATAGATGQVTAPAPTATPSSVEARLAKLSELKASGVIDEQEYAAKRQKIIDEM